ncbi:hypothetical protein CR513_24924, partial [Mucuna pruriens]
EAKNLEEILNEYISLKEEKMMLDQQRSMEMQEKNHIHMLLQGIQNAINSYNAFRRPPSGISPIINVTCVPQNMSNIPSLSKSVNTNIEIRNFSTPITNASDKKRKDNQTLNVSTVAKKPRGRPPGKKNLVEGQNTLPAPSNIVNNQVVLSQSSSNTQPSSENCIIDGLQVQGSSVSKCLSNHPSFLVPTNSPIPETPSRTYSSHIDTNQTSKRDCMGSKLNFNAFDMPKSLDKSLSKEVSTSKSDKKVDQSNIEFSNMDLDCLFGEILNDLEISSFEDIDFSDLPNPTHSKDNASWFDDECNTNP